MSAISSSRLGLGSSMNLECFLLIWEAITEWMPDPHDRTGTGSRPLNDIRAASQVCRRWRDTLLASSWIWGRVVDLGIQDHPQFEGPGPCRHGRRRADWMEEVVRRTGSASLWIFGDVVSPDTDTRFDSMSFFTRLLSKSWERVEILSVRFPGIESPETSIQTLFCSPAPNLKHFEVQWPNMWVSGTPHWDSSQRLFADHAPLLRTMKADGLPFDLRSPWLSGISEMIPIPSWITTSSDVLVLLQQMPMLRETQFQRFFSAVDVAAPLPTVHLPKLTSIISMIASLPNSARILEHLSPGNLSRFSLKVMGHHLRFCDWASPHIIQAFKKHLSQYISNFFSTNPSTNIQVRAINDFFLFRGISNHVGGHSTFDVSLPIGYSMWGGMDRDEAEIIIVCILDAVVVASTLPVGGNTEPGLFEAINEITLDLAPAPPPTIFTKLRSTFNVFPRIRSIHISKTSGQNLFSLCFPDPASRGSSHSGFDSDSDVVLFPELHTLSLIVLPVDYDPTNIFPDLTAFTDFLLERKKIGYPVARFDLTMLGQSACAPDLGCLEEVDGLEVAWTHSMSGVRPYSQGGGGRWDIRRHICGCGDPVIASGTAY